MATTLPGRRLPVVRDSFLDPFYEANSPIQNKTHPTPEGFRIDGWPNKQLHPALVRARSAHRGRHTQGRHGPGGLWPVARQHLLGQDHTAERVRSSFPECNDTHVNIVGRNSRARNLDGCANIACQARMMESMSVVRYAVWRNSIVSLIFRLPAQSQLGPIVLYVQVCTISAAYEPT